MEGPVEGPQHAHARPARIRSHAGGAAPLEAEIHEPGAGRQLARERLDLAVMVV